MSPKSTSKRKRSLLQWTEPMDQILVDALLHQVTKGNRANNQFTKTGFDEIVHQVRTKTQMDSINKEKVKNRIKTLKRSFTEAYELFDDLSGFRWNPITKLFEADNEVWNDLIKSDPGLIQWKTKPISQYDKLKEIWGKTIGMRQLSNACISQVGTEEALAEVVSGFINVMKRTVAILKDGNSILERSRPRVYSEAEVYAELERMELGEAVILTAYDFLTANQPLVRQMFGLPTHIRKDWLSQKIRLE